MKKYPFKIVNRTDKAGLIEAIRGGEAIRCTLPLEILLGETELTDEQINAGIPYGLPFSEFVKLSLNFAATLEFSLHNEGIWTLRDLQTHAQAVMGALQRTYQIELGKLVTAAVAYSSEPHQPKQAELPRQKKTKKE